MSDKTIKNDALDDKSYKVTDIKNGQVVKSDKRTIKDDQHGRRSFVSSIGGCNNLLFGDMYILPNVPSKGRR